MAGQYHTKNGRTSRRGAFINGVWNCDCEPRMPAEKFQTKNGGKNHGRWFLTCQKPQHKRCSFFLWSDDAKIREEAAVLNNSRTEPSLPPVAPQTPKKPISNVQPPTPVSVPKLDYQSAKRTLFTVDSPEGTTTIDDEESFGWSSSGDEDLAAVAAAVTGQETQSSRKAARTTAFDSPGKRGNVDIEAPSMLTDSTWALSEDGLMTPTTSTKSNHSISPSSKRTHHDQFNEQTTTPQTLTSSVLQILSPTKISSTVEHELIELLNRYELRTQGIAKGRDITRLAVQSKEKKIAELQAKITALEADRETSRAVIAHLKRDIATSPKKPSRRPPVQASRSEV